MGTRFLVIAAGGTGGHMFPAQALAEEMLARGWRVALSTDDRGLRYAGGFPAAVERRELASATFARGGLAEKLKAPLALLSGAREAIGWFKADRPDLVAGFGGYPAFPALTAAWRLGLPRLIHEQNGVLGRVNRLFAARVDALALGVSPVIGAPAGARLEPVGNPLRAAARALAGAPYAPPAPDGPIRLLIFGGSQGAGVFAASAPAAAAALPEPLRRRLRVTHQTRPETQQGAEAAYRAAGIEAELAPFFNDMPQRIADAHLVICRAGASSIAELTAIGRPAVLAPLPSAAADHQTANAAVLSEAGAADLVTDAALPERLGPLLTALLSDAPRLTAMAAAAKALGKPDAAERLADLAESLAESPRA